jgi:hypothetical protein
MSNPFPDHPTRPVSVDVLAAIEQVASTVWQLRDAMRAIPAEYRWLATSMTSHELTEILSMLHVDDREFGVRGIRDLGGLITTTPIVGDTAGVAG